MQTDYYNLDIKMSLSDFGGIRKAVVIHAGLIIVQY